MKHRGISQEGLKLIASVTMLMDHIGAVLVYSWYITQSRAQGAHCVPLWNCYLTLRVIGRIAFPIYCYQLVEGAHLTRNMTKYRGRLILGVILSEIPFNLAFSNTLVDFDSTSVMMTLLTGLVMIENMQKVEGIWKLLVIVPFYWLAEQLQTDYAGHGILIIAMLELTRGQEKEKLLRALAFCPMLWFGGKMTIGSVTLPIEMFAILALIPMFCYRGEKRSYSKVLQWIFYLFYPVHLLILWLMNCWIFG